MADAQPEPAFDQNVTFDREKVMRQLQEDGYAVIPNVIPHKECDKYINEYMDWTKKFGDDRPRNMHSLIQTYNIGHFETTWNVRLRAKPIFTEVWQTEKLLTSFDAVALGPPPELTHQQMRDPSHCWFHVDQRADRNGLHAYQGGLYLEETTECDWCFRVLRSSHKYLEQFYQEHPLAARETTNYDFYEPTNTENQWFIDKNCVPTVVPCPKGGIILWDSRTIHDNVRPECNRPNPERWRVVVFVSMTPAMWASIEDIRMKQEAYNSMATTTHWSSQGIRIFSEFIPPEHKNLNITQQSLPTVALSHEAQLLAGVKEYDFSDGEPNGSTEPQWEDHSETSDILASVY